MEIVSTVLAIIGFVTGIAALAVAAVSHVLNVSKIKAELAEAKAGLLGVENRLEKYADRRISESSIEVRQLAQQDAFDYLQAQQEGDMGNDLGFASFNRYNQ